MGCLAVLPIRPLAVSTHTVVMIGGRVTVHGWKNGFNSVAALATLLEDTPHPAGGSWLSRTTIWCMSDFSATRCSTALLVVIITLPTRHCCLAEVCLVGWSLVGPLNSKMKSQKVDLHTGAVNENGVYKS